MKKMLLFLALVSCSMTVYSQTVTWSMDNKNPDQITHRYFIDGVEVKDGEVANSMEEDKGLKLIKLPVDGTTKEGKIDLLYLLEQGTWQYLTTDDTEPGKTYTAKPIQDVGDHLVVYDEAGKASLFVKGAPFELGGERSRNLLGNHYVGSDGTGALLEYPMKSTEATFHKPKEMRGMWVINLDGQHFYFVCDGEYSLHTKKWTTDFSEGHYHIDTGAGKKYIFKNIQSLEKGKWAQGEAVN